MTYDRRLMVKQYVAIVQNQRGQKFRVFRTGDDKYYLFDPLIPGTDCSGLVPFPVRKTSLRREIASALAHGVGNSD